MQRLFEKLTAFRLKRAGRPDLIPVLTPSFPPGCKRIAKSENYLEALAKPNVTVVPRAVKDAQGNVLIDSEGNAQQADVLVLATGFDVQGFLGNLESKCFLASLARTHRIYAFCFFTSQRKR